MIIPIIVAIAGLIFINISEDDSGESDIAFHVTLANPDQYQNGVYSETIQVKNGEYRFDFVPNGDSPEKLTISLLGETSSYTENFSLKGTLHETGISEYYTWEYVSDNENQITLESEKLEIQINPNGNVLGPVSISLIEN